jgi:hypothetical protein
MLDEKEFLSQYGIRAMSKVYEENPFKFSVHGTENVVIIRLQKVTAECSGETATGVVRSGSRSIF